MAENFGFRKRQIFRFVHKKYALFLQDVFDILLIESLFNQTPNSHQVSGCPARSGDEKFVTSFQDKIDSKRVYSEVIYATRSEFIRHTLDDSAPIAKFQGYKSESRTVKRPTVAARLARPPPTKANRAQSLVGSPDFRKWESCRMMPLVRGFSRGSPVSPAPSFRCRSSLTSITLIGSQDVAVKSHPNLFPHTWTTANEQTSEVRLDIGLWSLACKYLNSLTFPIPSDELLLMRNSEKLGLLILVKKAHFARANHLIRLVDTRTDGARSPELESRPIERHSLNEPAGQSQRKDRRPLDSYKMVWCGEERGDEKRVREGRGGEGEEEGRGGVGSGVKCSRVIWASLKIEVLRADEGEAM
ncbi:hypothetical protein PR048_028173 [Dryococelus australis]|uniref:Uncharacterized protein n=1 Tax=Dryococelus australis TaxID=614101 RepID=A0ABQ9GIH6_9NEOP|nr:hypothetical protein PR048_028173 [Dryococelus australis]